MENNEIIKDPIVLFDELERKKTYLRNTKQVGEGFQLLQSLENNSVALALFDPQYEKSGDVSRVKDWPLHCQSEHQIIYIIKELARVLKPGGFCFLWVSKNILKSDRVNVWLLQASKLKIVDLLVWNKDSFGFGSYFRSKGEFGFLLQKNPTSFRKFTNRSFPNVWDEVVPSDTKRLHPHQKPFFLLRTLIEATTKEGDLVVDPCAGSFIALDACKSTGREFIGVDLTYEELKEHNTAESKQERERERETEAWVLFNWKGEIRKWDNAEIVP